MIVRHKLLADLVRLWKNDQLVEKIDRLPIEPESAQIKTAGALLRTQRTCCMEIQDLPADGTGYDG